MEIVQVNIVDIVPYENNPRKNDKAVDVVVKSIKEYGFLVPVILDDKNVIVAGHTRVKAAIKLGMENIPVVYAENLTDKQIKAFRIMDNKSSEYSDWDENLLTQELDFLKGEGFNLDLTGFSELELDRYTTVHEHERELPNPKEPKYQVETGDIWSLGEHRVMCGDATIKEDVDKLMNEQKADLLLTDPPYGINIVGNGKTGISGELGFKGEIGVSMLARAGKYREVIGDDKPFDPTFLLDYCEKKIIFGANNFASKLPDNSQWLVWDKKCEKGADHNNFSDCELAWTNIKAKSIRIYRHLWSGLLREGERNDELIKRVHPTQKPVGLMREIIRDYCDKSILDLFGGSGSTLIACEQLKRKCFMMEIDPNYCSVIIERWENLTGEKAVKQ